MGSLKFYELLVIFCVALFIVLLIYDLLGLGPFRQITVSESKAYWTAQQISIEPNYKIRPKEIDLTLKNNFGSEVRILQIIVDEKIFTPNIILKESESADLVLNGIKRCNIGKFARFKISIVFEDENNKTFTIGGNEKHPLVGLCEE